MSIYEPLLIKPYTSAPSSPSQTFLHLALYRDLLWPALLQLAWGVHRLWNFLPVQSQWTVKPGFNPEDTWFPPEHFILLPLHGQYLGGKHQKKPKESIPPAWRRDTKDFENGATQSKFCKGNINLEITHRLSVQSYKSVGKWTQAINLMGFPQLGYTCSFITASV